jgi:LemA protein
MLYAIGIIAAVALLAVFVMYNTLIVKKNRIENAFSTIDTQLKKRYDLIPNLVSTVKGYAKHEKELFQRITDLRANAMKGDLTSDETVGLNNQISQALLGVMAVVENYPDLKASNNFLHLQRTLNEIEEQISAARRAFNAAVTDFNNSVEMFPSSIMANLMRYKTRRLFEIPAAERRNVDMKEQLETNRGEHNENNG